MRRHCPRAGLAPSSAQSKHPLHPRVARTPVVSAHAVDPCTEHASPPRARGPKWSTHPRSTSAAAAAPAARTRLMRRHELKRPRSGL
jgi:hypothetical protein